MCYSPRPVGPCSQAPPPRVLLCEGACLLEVWIHPRLQLVSWSMKSLVPCWREKPAGLVSGLDHVFPGEPSRVCLNWRGSSGYGNPFGGLAEPWAFELGFLAVSIRSSNQLTGS